MSTLEAIQSLVIGEQKSSKRELLLNLVKQQQYSRSVATATRKSKASASEVKHNLDKLHLTLQNLQYECQYLHQEIWKCDSQE